MFLFIFHYFETLNSQDKLIEEPKLRLVKCVDQHGCFSSPLYKVAFKFAGQSKSDSKSCPVVAVLNSVSAADAKHGCLLAKSLSQNLFEFLREFDIFFLFRCCCNKNSPAIHHHKCKITERLRYTHRQKQTKHLR